MSVRILAFGLFLFLMSCSKQDFSEAEFFPEKNNRFQQEMAGFEEIGQYNFNAQFAAEISAYDEVTKRLFVVNNSVAAGNRIDILDLTNPAVPVKLDQSIDVPGGLVNSVAVSGGLLAAAVEATNKQANGKVVVFNTSSLNQLADVTVGALPDMVTFTPDGKFILTANEGEPNNAYTVDPKGSVSLISVDENFSVTNMGFSAFVGQEASLKARGFRVFGPTGFEEGIEPEYIAVAANSQKAWVSLQENNAIARIDIRKRAIEEILPLGFKNYNLAGNSIDPSDADGGIFFNPWPVYGMYLPDAIAVMPGNNVPFVFSANEGDQREYSGYNEIRRVRQVNLDPTAFPVALNLKADNKLGRLNITRSLGDTDNDGDYDELYSFGARSFTIWNGLTGQKVFDSGDELDKIAASATRYPENRSDDKGAEPESVEIGRVGNKNILFVGLERADMVVLYDVTNPVRPVYLQYLLTGDAPEGLLFVEAAKSPTGKSLLIVSNEEDGKVNIFSTE